MNSLDDLSILANDQHFWVDKLRQPLSLSELTGPHLLYFISSRDGMKKDRK